MSGRRTPSYATVASTLALVLALTGTAYASGLVTGTDVKNGSLTGKDLRDGSVKASDLKAGTIPAPHPAQPQTQPSPLATGSVTGAHLKDETLTGVDVRDNSLFGNDLANGTVTSQQIKTGTISALDIADTAFPGARIENNSITTLPTGKTTIPMETEDFDVDDMHLDGSDSIVIGRTGRYLLIGTINLGHQNAGAEQVTIAVNGEQVAFGAYQETTGHVALDATTVQRLQPGAHITLEVTITSGTAKLDDVPGIPKASLTVQYLGA